MNSLLKQATITKLAQTRLAINYILRNRYMNKQADMEYNQNNWLYNKNGDMNLLGNTFGRLFGFPTHNQAYDNPKPNPYSGQHINAYDSAESTREYINGMENGPLKNKFKQQYYDWHVAPGINGTHPNKKMIPPPIVPAGKAPQKWTPKHLSKQPYEPTGQLGLYPPSQFPTMPNGTNRELPIPEEPQDIIAPEIYSSRYYQRKLPPLRLADKPKPMPKRERGTLVPINRGFEDGLQLWGTPPEDLIEDMERFEAERARINPTGTPGADYLPYNPYE